MDYKLNPSEWRVLQTLWGHAPQTLMQLVSNSLLRALYKIYYTVNFVKIVNQIKTIEEIRIKIPPGHMSGRDLECRKEF